MRVAWARRAWPPGAPGRPARLAAPPPLAFAGRCDPTGTAAHSHAEAARAARRTTADLPPAPPPSTPHGEDLPSAEKPGGIADYLLDGLGTMFRNSGGARGNDKTRKKNDVVARECKAVIKEEFMDGVAGEHQAGAHKDGGDEYLPEETVWADPKNPVRRGSVRPDLTWKITLPDGTEEWVRLNTVDTRADGQPTTRELNALDRLRKYLQDDLADWMAKGDDDPDSPEFAERARAKCREIFEKYVRKDVK